MKERPFSNVEKQFVTAALAEGLASGQPLRADGRQPHEPRACTVNVGPDYGHAVVTLGNTRAVAQVSCEVAAPFPDRPTEGLVRYAVLLSPMASPGYDVAIRTASEAVDLTRLLEHTFREGRVLDTESLCIEAGEKVWSLRVQVTITDNDGNLGDCCVLAALAGMLHFRRPFVALTGDKVVIHTYESHEPTPLAVHHRPFAVTLGMLPSLNMYIVDPNRLEAEVCDGTVTVAMNTHNEVCTIISSGGPAIRPSMMLEMLNVVKENMQILAATLEAALTGIRAGASAAPKAKARPKKITETQVEPAPVDIDEDGAASDDEDMNDKVQAASLQLKKAKLVAEGPGTATLFQGQDAWSQ